MRLTGRRLAPRIRVLMSPGVGISNPFVRMLVDSLDADILVEEFTWRRALTRSYEVLHVHWPDALLDAPTPARRLLKLVEFTALLANVRLRRVATIWTVHNMSPHEDQRHLQTALLGLWNRWCDIRVFLSNAAAADVDGERTAVIRHGDYSAVVDPRFDADSVPVSGRLIVFGLLREYKGVEGLIDSVIDAGPDLSLRIAGRPFTQSYGDDLIERGADAAVSLRLERLSDDDLIREISEAEMVVLPYRRVYNSGAALLALGCRRPVIVTASSTMRELQAEVGEEWMYCVEGELTGSTLRAAVLDLRHRRRSGSPTLTVRDWRTIGVEYSALYREATARRGSTESSPTP